MYSLTKFIKKVLMVLPLPMVGVIGTVLGWTLSLNIRKRSVVLRNVKAVFPEKNAVEVEKICRRSFYNFGMNIMEMFIFERIIDKVAIKGTDQMCSGSNVMVGIHAGNWEIYNAAFSRQLPLAVIAKKQKNPGVDKFINEIRSSNGVRVSFSLKEIIKHIKDNHNVGLVIDHGAEDKATCVEFFSYLVPTPGGAVQLALKFNRPIYVSFGYRTVGFSHILEISGPLETKGKNEAQILREINCFYEEKLRRHPGEYLWQYKRFKHKITRDVLIISDGKAGHLKQSQAFLRMLSEENYVIRGKVVEINYQNSFCRFLSEVFAVIAWRNCPTYANILKLLLDKKSIKNLDNVYADIVISTGTIAAPVNRIVASSWGAKSVAILKPNIPLRYFDLVILPAHDRVEYKNVVIIKGALSYPVNIEGNMNECRKTFGLDENKKIALFVGGPLSDTLKFTANFKLFVNQFVRFARAGGYKILISTSRRTPKDIEKYLSDTVRGNDVTAAEVYPNKNNYPFVFDGFCGLSDMVFVTSDSISMNSEIVAIGKPCVTVFLENPTDKLQVFFESISADINNLNYPYELAGIAPCRPKLFEYNRKIIKSAIQKII